MEPIERGQDRDGMQTHVLQVNVAELLYIKRAIEYAYNRELDMRRGLFATPGVTERTLFHMWQRLEQYSLNEFATRKKKGAVV